MADNISLIIADDHPIVRQGLRQTIEKNKRLTVAAEAGNGEEAIKFIEEIQPNIAILDVDMPGMNGFDVARWIRKKDLPTEMIFLTMHSDEDIFNEAIDLGAKGFVLKDSALTDIVECINAVAQDQHYTSHALTSFLLNRSKRAIQMSEDKPLLNDLTTAERRVLKLIAENLTTNEIAKKLFVSPRTIERHRYNISRKLDLQGSNSLLKFALLNKSKLL
ncbi:MAG: response regulator transcription factor [Pyrinomonadaceae bacterium]|nr:response regulator transcription factor [Pyrinomonadaceae bacterium]